MGHGIGHGIGSVGGFAGRKIGLTRKKDKSGKEVLVEHNGSGGTIPEEQSSSTPPSYDVPAGQASQPSDMDGFTGIPASPVATTLPPGQGSGPSEPGMLTVTVLSAKDLKSKEGPGAKPFVQLRMGGKVHKTGHLKGIEPEWCVKRHKR